MLTMDFMIAEQPKGLLRLSHFLALSTPLSRGYSHISKDKAFLDVSSNIYIFYAPSANTLKSVNVNSQNPTAL